MLKKKVMVTPEVLSPVPLAIRKRISLCGCICYL